MTTSLRIAEVADRVGISTATVRYYERIGVLPPPRRAGNGYRVYDDHTVERLRFVGRAKQLGCNLDEIADLVAAWDGGECGPVQDRLQALVAAKLEAAQAEIVALVQFTADLRRADASLRQHRPAGPCDDRCGCVSGAESSTAGEPASTTAAGSEVPTGFPVAFSPRRPAATSTATAAAVSSGTITSGTAVSPEDGGPPLVCTLAPDRVSDRLESWMGLTGGTDPTVNRTAIPGGVRVELGPGADPAAVARLAAAEHDCCRFFSFRLTIDERGVGLEVEAPDEALPVVHAMVGVPA